MYFNTLLQFVMLLSEVNITWWLIFLPLLRRFNLAEPVVEKSVIL